MTLSSPHILIVEEEFLISLDAEYLIAAAMECRISMWRPKQFDDADDELLKGFSLCLLDAPLNPDAAVARAARLRRAGVAVLFTTVSETHRGGVAGMPEMPVVMKPFDSDALTAAVNSALASG